MDKVAANALKRARNIRHITQEGLAEMSGWSVDMIQAWERSTRMPSLETLHELAKYLDSPWLPDTYIRERTDVLNDIIPDYQANRPLAEAVAGYINAVLDLVDERFDRKLLRIVADGCVDALEKETYQRLMDKAQEVNKAYYEMRFAKTDV